MSDQVIVIGHLKHIHYGQVSNVYSRGGISPTLTTGNHGCPVKVMVEVRKNE